MGDAFSTLLERADRTVAGPEANAALWETHVRLSETIGQAINYEIVLSGPDQVWPAFLEAELVKLLDHLQAKHSKLPDGPGLCVGLWSTEQVHIFEGPAFIEHIADIEGCTVDTLIDRVRLWQAQRDARLEGVQALLPPGLGPTT